MDVIYFLYPQRKNYAQWMVASDKKKKENTHKILFNFFYMNSLIFNSFLWLYSPAPSIKFGLFMIVKIIIIKKLQIKIAIFLPKNLDFQCFICFVFFHMKKGKIAYE